MGATAGHGFGGDWEDEDEMGGDGQAQCQTQ